MAKLREADREKNKRINGELIACMAFLSYCAHGNFEHLQLLQKRYPQSFSSAYGEGDLVMVAQHVKSRMREILKQIGFVEPALRGNIRDLEHKMDRITHSPQKGLA